MIGLLLALAAHASGPVVACDIFDPIGGTAGHDNALHATRTNASTYSAGTFARRRLRGLSVAAFDQHVVAGVTRVPSWCRDSEGRIAQEMYLQPVDLSAANLGLGGVLFRDGPLNSRFKVFYAASVTQTTTMPRAVMWTAPIFSLYTLAFAPVVGRSHTGTGVDAYTVDWIGGAYFGSDVISVQAGYTGGQGLYLDVTQEKIALFVNTLFDDGLSLEDANYLMTGIQGFDPAKENILPEEVGVTSAFYRRKTLIDSVEPDLVEQLRTGHLQQEDLGGLVDLRAAWQFGDQARLHEASIAVHTRQYIKRLDRDPDEPQLYLRGGIVNLPDLPTMGVNGGIRPTVHADFKAYSFGDVKGDVRVSVRVNDPELLVIFPYAYNAVGLNFEITGSLGEK